MDRTQVRAETARDRALGASGGAVGSGRRRMLLVEDDPELVRIVERIAASVDPALVVDRAADVPGARRLLARRRYEVVLADLLLRGRESGLALGPLCRRTGSRFALMSAFPPGRDLQGTAHGRCPFLPKPFTLASCRDFLAGLLAPAPPASRSAAAQGAPRRGR